MCAAYSDDATAFSNYLIRVGEPFLLLDDSDSEQVHVRFSGPFQNTEVVWDCLFVTLKSELQRYRLPALRCFIEIGAMGEHGVALRVGLNIQRIERPDILKMITMIRQYKRLHQGRHEFGQRYLPEGVA